MTPHALGIPIVAATVALMQMTCANASTLSPWKGGGFGMFASTDNPVNRVLMVEAIDRDGIPYRVRFRSERLPGALSARFRARTTTFPSVERLEQMGRAVLAADLRDAADGLPSIPPDLEHSIYAPVLRRLSSRARVLDLVGSAGRAAAHRRIRSVGVEVLRVEFDPGVMEVRLRRVLAATIEGDSR